MRKELICTILFIALLAVLPVNAAPGPGLVGLWHFDTVDATADPHTTPDSSGKGNTGYLLPIGSEPTLVDGKFLKALSFSGTNYVQVGHSTSMDVSNSYTFEAWVRLNDEKDYRGIFRRGTSGVLASEIEIYIWPGPTSPKPSDRRLVVVHNRNGAFCYTYFTPFPLNQWVHLAVTWGSTTLRAYYDGVNQNPVGGTPMVSPATSDKPSIIGQGYSGPPWVPGNTPFMMGLIDEARLWDVALTAEQVKADFDVSSYVFSWLPPLSLEKAAYKSGSTIPMKFTVKAGGAFVHDESVMVKVDGPGSGYPLVFVYGTGGDTNVRINDLEQLYIVDWHLEGTSEGQTYTITVLFRDMPVGSIVVTIKQ